MAKLNTHQIRVETESEQVNVTIGEAAAPPGGFAKFFNRVIDSGVWAGLSDAARAAYMPLVRFADHRNQFRVRIGHAGLMKHAGLSRSSVKRALKDLLAHRLIVVVDPGGVTPDGQNESNLYQLLVPARDRQDAPVGPAADPLPVLQRTPTRATVEPPASPAPTPLTGRLRTASRSAEPPAGGSVAGPQYRNRTQELNNNTPASPATMDGGTPAAAALLLVEKGVDFETSRSLAAQFPYQRIVDVVAAMEYRRARGKCDNPGGFIREALVKQWQTPRAVLDARERAEARLKQQAAEQRAREAEAAQENRADEDERRVERLVASLDDEELALLAAGVLRKYDDNPTVRQVLTRRPPRECRLMRMEIAAMLEKTAR